MPKLFLKIYLYSATILTALFFCTADISATEKDTFTIWAHSDIQPRNKAERRYYETAISDVNANIPDIDIAIAAGDIIHWSKAANDYKWYIDTKNKSYIKYWYEIAGNHDQKDYENYKKIINMPLDYSVSAGNMLLLFLSDETKSAETNISDAAFEWWKNMVIANQDKIIITVTHAYLRHSGLFGSIEPTRNIRNSGRFAEVLKKYKVDIWLCGHMHLPHWVNSRIATKKNLNGTLFMNVSFIRGTFGKPPESNILIFKNNSDIVSIRSRNHEKQKFANLLDFDFRLSRKFMRDSNEPVMTPMKQENK